MTTRTAGHLGLFLGLVTWVPGTLTTFAFFELGDRLTREPETRSGTIENIVLSLYYPVLMSQIFEDLLGDDT